MTTYPSPPARGREIFINVGVDKRSAHFVFPVQAKGGSDRLSIVQIMQDFGLCREKFPNAICRPIAAQFMDEDVIALFELEDSARGIVVASEKHYRLCAAPRCPYRRPGSVCSSSGVVFLQDESPFNQMLNVATHVVV